MARIGKYEPDIHIPKAEYMARAGHKDKEIFEAFQISKDTYYRWINKYSDFCEAIKRGRQFDDNLVLDAENSLKKLIKGYEYEEVEEKQYVKIDNDGKKYIERGHVIKKKKHIAPNMGAIAYFLNNRRSERWNNDGYNNDNSGKEVVGFEFTVIKDED